MLNGKDSGSFPLKLLQKVNLRHQKRGYETFVTCFTEEREIGHVIADLHEKARVSVPLVPNELTQVPVN